MTEEVIEITVGYAGNMKMLLDEIGKKEPLLRDKITEAKVNGYPVCLLKESLIITRLQPGQVITITFHMKDGESLPCVSFSGA